ncbi:uncharacterized protein TNCV_1062131 [Trichonephila clavipes]|nr:uncharacterized protein TNCV_1062131 [Trichonephila clavipes]
MGHLIAEIVRQLGFSRPTVSREYQKYMDGGQRTINEANCKGQLALTEWAERGLRRIISSQQSQALAGITTHLNDGASITSRFRLLTPMGGLDYGVMTHESMDPAWRIGTVLGYGDSIMIWSVFVALFMSIGVCTNLPKCNSERRDSG